jgi:hypothetical protein
MIISLKTKERLAGRRTRRSLPFLRTENYRTEKVFIFLVVFCVSFSLASFGFGSQVSPPAKGQEVQAKPQPEKIVGAPGNIKQRTAVYVFLGWMWGSIAVLVYFLRLKIKEADRLYYAGYFLPDKK